MVGNLVVVDLLRADESKLLIPYELLAVGTRAELETWNTGSAL